MFDKIFEIVETIEPNIFYRTQFFQSNEVHENIPKELADCAKRNGVRNFVHLSALNIDKTHNSYYSKSKLAGEAAMTDVGITGGKRGNNMLYLSGVQSEKVLTDDMIEKVVSEVEKKAFELEKN